MNNKDSDIQNLNSPMEYNKEEKIEVQKKFFLLGIIFIIVIILFFIVFIYLDNIKNIFKEDEVIEEIKEEDSSMLYNRQDGVISTNDKEIQKLFSRLYLNYNEYFIFNSNLLYTTSIDKYSDKDKLFLISKTERFYKLVDKKENIYTKEQLCNSPITINKDDVDKIAKDNFNLDKINHSSFLMSYIKDNVFLSYMQFKYENDKYVGTCIELEKQPQTMIASSIINVAQKDKDYIYIDLEVIFQTEKGIYKDYELTKLISATYIEENELNYYAMGSKYRVYYKYNGKKDYYLEKITLIK